MENPIQNVPAIKLARANGIQDQLNTIRGRKLSLEAIRSTLASECLLLPVDTPGTTDSRGYTFELSLCGAADDTRFFHVIYETQFGLEFFSLTLQGVVAAGNYGPMGATRNRLSFDWGPRDWARCSVAIDRGGFYYAATSQGQLQNPFFRWTESNMGRGWEYFRIVALILGAEDADEMIFADVRCWGIIDRSLEDRLELLGGWRLDGREQDLLRYWKLADFGEDGLVIDSSRFRTNGWRSGGVLIGAAESGLSLDCRLEMDRNLTALLGSRVKEHWDLGVDADLKRTEWRTLQANITALNGQIASLAHQIEQIALDREHELSGLKTRFDDWKQELERNGRVRLDDFTQSWASEVQSTNDRLAREKQPYQLQEVSLEVKTIPVLPPGQEDFFLTFPLPNDDRINPGQLSTMQFNFTPRPAEPQPMEGYVPDVRGYTSAAAQRILQEAGYNTEVIEQATEVAALFDRVISQDPMPGKQKKTRLSEVVRILLGRSSLVRAV